DCIRAGTDFEGLRLLRPASFQEIQSSVCFIHNIGRMGNSSIKFGKVNILVLQRYTINILPKLILYEENVIEKLSLDANKQTDLFGILRAADNSIRFGKVKRLELLNYSINILPKLKLHEEGDVEVLYLGADETEHLSEILRVADNSILVGKVKRLELFNYAISILPKLKLHKENEMEELHLSSDKEEYVSEAILGENNSIQLGKVRKLELKLFAINVLPKLKLHEKNEMEELHLSAEKKEYVSEVICAENNSIWLGKVNNLELELFAINILPKLKLHGANVMEEFSLSADKEEYVSEAIRAKNSTIWLGKMKKLDLELFAINILPKLVLHEENEMEEFCLSAEKKEYVSEIIRAENNSICLGKVNNLDLELFAINILPKLKLHGANVMEEFSLSADKE
ncbi:MAG: uncharacterized protein A8A55_3233, partial [Amphiamblys sp. WSBS2006]